MGEAVVVDGLSKRYGRRVVLQEATFRIGVGDVHGLLGYRGAGKSTLLKILLGLVNPSSGRAYVLGHDVAKESFAVRREVGYLPERMWFPAKTTVSAFLRFVGLACGLWGDELRQRLEAVLSEFRLSELATARMHGLSRGELRRVGLAQALLHNPGVLLADEPTAGLDEAAKAEVLGIIRRFAEGGGTVLLSTGAPFDAEAACRRVSIIDRARVLATGSLWQLRTVFQAETVDELCRKVTGRDAT